MNVETHGQLGDIEDKFLKTFQTGKASINDSLCAEELESTKAKHSYNNFLVDISRRYNPLSFHHIEEVSIKMNP